MRRVLILKQVAIGADTATVGEIIVVDDVTRDRLVRDRLGEDQGEASGVADDAAANHNVTASESGTYIRMTKSDEAKTVTFRPDATHALPNSGVWNIRNAGAEVCTLTAGEGVTLNAPAGGTLVLDPHMNVTVIRVAQNVFDVIGQTVAEV